MNTELDPMEMGRNAVRTTTEANTDHHFTNVDTLMALAQTASMVINTLSTSGKEPHDPDVVGAANDAIAFIKGIIAEYDEHFVRQATDTLPDTVPDSWL